MRHRSLSGAMLAAVLILIALAAAPASGLENPELLPNPTISSPLKVTALAGGVKLISAVATIQCHNIKNSGEFTSTRLGKLTIQYHECTTGGVACHTSGDPGGTFLFLNADMHLVDVLSQSVLSLGLAVTPALTTIDCGTLTAELKGTVIGLFGSVTSGSSIPANAFKVLFVKPTSVGGTKQEFKTCDLDKAFCEGKAYELLANLGSGFKELAQEGNEEVGFNKTVSIDF